MNTTKLGWTITYIIVGMVLFGGVSYYVIDNSPTVDSLADKVAQVRSAVVHIEKEGEWQGSGFIVGAEGLIVTAKHVVEGGGTFIVTLDDGTQFRTNITVESTRYDVGFLSIHTDKPLPAVALCLQEFGRPGDSVFIIGTPLGYENFNSVTLGIISAEQRDLSPYDEGLGWSILFQSDAQAYPGNSGGPVFNMHGEVIGVLVAGVGPGLNYSVPVKLFIEDLNVVRLLVAMYKFNVPDIEQDNFNHQVMSILEDMQEEIDWLVGELNNIEEVFDASRNGTSTESGCSKEGL